LSELAGALAGALSLGTTPRNSPVFPGQKNVSKYIKTAREKSLPKKLVKIKYTKMSNTNKICVRHYDFKVITKK